MSPLGGRSCCPDLDVHLAQWSAEERLIVEPILRRLHDAEHHRRWSRWRRRRALMADLARLTP